MGLARREYGVTMDLIRDWAILVAAVAGAFITLVTAGGIWLRWGRRVRDWFTAREAAAQAWRDCVEAKIDTTIERITGIEQQIKVNGSRDVLPETMRDLGLADLVVQGLVALRAHEDMTAPLIQRFLALEEQHREGTP